MNNALLPELRRQLQSVQSILIVSHIRPDGDALGSLIGLGLSLQAAGKTVQMVSADGVPASYRHLASSEQVRNRPQGEFDWIVTVDCSDMQRTGEALKGYRPPDVNIDHHVTNLNFAKINLVEPKAVATAEVLYDLIHALELPLPQEAAAALLAGLITDTLGFRTSNMTPKALRVAADLMERGADLPELYRKTLIEKTYEAARMWGEGLSQMEREGSLVWATLTQAGRQAAGYGGRDDADLINVLSSITDADISIVFVEQPNGHVKISWRAQPGFDVSQIALSFGGGGHPAAAGADMAGTLEEVKTAVLPATRLLLANGSQPH